MSVSGSNDAEDRAIESLRVRLGVAPDGELWVGDDAAVLLAPGATRLLFAADAIVDGIHFDRRYSSLADIGWKALAVNVSDIAAMGGAPRAAVMTVIGATTKELDELYDGLQEAAAFFGCPVVGGDLSSGPVLSLSVAILGDCADRAPVRRDGARAGDQIFVTRPLGAASAGLRALQAGTEMTGAHVDAHRRPIARLAEGQAAALAGAHSMIDISDGFSLDLSRLLDASGRGAVIEEVPVAALASIADALSGGEDFELLFSAPDANSVKAGFGAAGLVEPRRIGEIVADAAQRTVLGKPLLRSGYQHRLGD